MEEAEEEPQRQMALVAPRESNFLCGHDSVETMLLKLVSEKHVPHALIFAGPSGIGKATMAYRLARFLLSGNNPESGLLSVSFDSKTFKQVASSGHPDLLTIEKPEGKNAIPVEEARRIAPFLRLTSSGGGWRVAIVDDADTMNRNSQNAILKILEEPPDNALLILVAHRPGAFVPTIRSRCRIVNLKPLLTEDMLSVLDRSPAFSELDTASKKRLLDIAQGSPGTALRYLGNSSLETFEAVMDVMQSYPEIDWQKAHQLADILSSSGQENAYADFQDILITRMQGATKAKTLAKEEPLGKIMKDCSLADLVKICENLEQHFKQANMANLDKRQCVLGAFMILRNREAK
jgi:DNA polymerase-3 subunit delta'